jgi:hypothetical protein
MKEPFMILYLVPLDLTWITKYAPKITFYVASIIANTI